MPLSVLATIRRPESVEHIPTRDETGRQIIYDDEPELSGAAIPRVARLTDKVVRQRRLFWNVLFILIGAFGFFWQRSYYGWTYWLQHGKVVYADRYTDSPDFTIDGKMKFFYQLPPEAGSIRIYDSVPRQDFYHMKGIVPITYVPGSDGRIWREGVASAADRSRDSYLWIFGGLIVCAGWGKLLADRERRWRYQLHLLRQGVAVPGHIERGIVSQTNDGEQYQVQYSYSAGGQQHQGKMQVTREQYQQYTEQMPYFTLFYDVSHPEKHMPYCKIDSAKLVAAETK